MKLPESHQKKVTMTKLTKLNGAENLPNTEECGIVLDEEKMAFRMAVEDNHQFKNAYYRRLAKHLASQPEKFIKIVKE